MASSLSYILACIGECWPGYLLQLLLDLDRWNRDPGHIGYGPSVDQRGTWIVVPEEQVRSGALGYFPPESICGGEDRVKLIAKMRHVID